MRKYERICEKCGKKLIYSSYSAYWLAEKNASLCKSCSIKNVAKRKCDASKLLDETPESYYWIGFLLADGNFRDGRINFTLSIRDKEQLIKFAKFINYQGKIRETSIYATISSMHKEIVNKLCETFDIKENKTYNPPFTILNHNEKLLKYLFIGFIDGDGNIERQYKRKDCFIRIKVHKSWEKILKEFCSIIGYDTKHVRVNKQKYCELYISNSSIVNDLKKESNKIPVLKRKWSKIDENFKSKKVKAIETKNKVIKMLNEGIRKCDIAKQLSISNSLVTKISKCYEK